VLLAKILWIGVSLAGGWKRGGGFWRFASTLIYLVAHDGKKKKRQERHKNHGICRQIAEKVK